MRRGFIASSLCIAIVGCSGGPSVVAPPSFDVSTASEEAMALYDKSGDGFIDEAELVAAPGLKAALKNLDRDGDGKVSKQEVADRVAAWIKQETGLTMISCEVTLDGRPIQGAIVTFEPDGFLQGVIQEAVGDTNLVGLASPKIPKEKRPSPDSPPGMQIGIYKVKISKLTDGKEIIPAIYNSETILGQEVSSDDPAILNKQVRFTLKSK
jgi:hypothetical protein